MPITYDLMCTNGHKTESRFANSDAYEQIRAAGHLICIHCTAPQEKLPSAPGLVGLPSRSVPPQVSERDKIAALYASSDDVGEHFYDRAIALNNKTLERPIRGSMTLGQVISLTEKGIPFMQLPPLPKLDS